MRNLESKFKRFHIQINKYVKTYKEAQIFLGSEVVNMIEIKHHTECECKETKIKVLVRFGPTEIFSHFSDAAKVQSLTNVATQLVHQRGRHNYMFYCSHFFRQSEHAYEKKLFSETPTPCPA